LDAGRAGQNVRFWVCAAPVNACLYEQCSDTAGYTNGEGMAAKTQVLSAVSPASATISGYPMRQSSTVLTFDTRGQGLLEVTDRVSAWQRAQDVDMGLLTVFCRHTSASLLIQENAALEVRGDIERYFARIAPESDAYAHDDEGPDDMPAHLRTALTQVQLTIPVMHGELTLGTWQGIYLFEHRRRAHSRELALHIFGE
jgi:secondary thiamine-phosphate synthase enzyme